MTKLRLFQFILNCTEDLESILQDRKVGRTLWMLETLSPQDCQVTFLVEMLKSVGMECSKTVHHTLPICMGYSERKHGPSLVEA